MKRVATLLCAGVCGLLTAWGQTSGRLPWVNGIFPTAKNGFEYRVASGDAATLQDARLAALNDFLAQVSSLAGVEVTSETLAKVTNTTEESNKTSSWKETLDFQKTTLIKGKNINVAFVKVSEYYEYTNRRYQLWELYEISTTSAGFKSYTPQYTEHYGIHGAWRSAVVPGFGQFHKGKIGKGVFFLTAEMATISGAAYCEMRRSNNLRKSQETTNLSIIKEYHSRADSWELYRNAAIGAAAGVYVWNVLDAALAKGKVRYAWIPNNIHLTTFAHNDICYYGVVFNF